MKVAFLVYSSWSESRRTNNSFDGSSNIGCYMLIDVLARNNIIVDFCSVDSAHKFDIVMVSFTSIYDILAYYKQVARHKNFKKPRKFKIIGGGFGMQNPIAISEYLDYAWFGRCENEIYDIIKSNLEFEHPSLMNLKNIKNVFINQVSNLYPYDIKLNSSDKSHNNYKEKSLGCPHKCFFCHYSFSRKNYIKDNNLYNISLYSSSQEVDMFNIDKVNYKIPRIITAIDGIDEPLRYFVNKRISNELIKHFILELSSRTEVKGKAVFLTLYNITNYEIETIEHYNNFKKLLISIEPLLKKRIVLVLHSTPLHPSPLTPMAYSKVCFGSVLNNKMSGKDIIKETANLKSKHSLFQESDWRAFESLSVERATDNNKHIFHNIVFNNSLNKYRSKDKLKIMLNKFDCSSLIKEYMTNEQLPTWFLNSYISNDKIKKMRELQINKYIRPVNNSIEIK